jgi:hypothetical protein
MHPNAAGYRAYQAPIVAALSPLFDKPAAPRNLIRGTMTPTAISIKWIDNSINEDVFQIRHRTGANAWTTVQVPWRTQSWTLDGLTLGQTHIFEVQSCSYIAQSCSDWVPLSVVLQPPAAPSNVHFARIRVPRINVPGGVPRPSYIDYSIQWNDNSNNEESFEIEMLEGSTWTSLRTVSANETVLHFGDNSLDIGLTGHYRVRACISKVCSDWSMSP